MWEQGVGELCEQEEQVGCELCPWVSDGFQAPLPVPVLWSWQLCPVPVEQSCAGGNSQHNCFATKYCISWG